MSNLTNVLSVICRLRDGKYYKATQRHQPWLILTIRDLLHRHYVVHGRDGNQEPLTINGMIPKSAGRTPIACINCAKTKTKCDKKFPCTRCSTRNLECTVRPTRRTVRGMTKPIGTMDSAPPNEDTEAGSKESQSAPESATNSVSGSPRIKNAQVHPRPERPASACSSGPPKSEPSPSSAASRRQTPQRKETGVTPRAAMSSPTGTHTPPAEKPSSQAPHSAAPFANGAGFPTFDTMMSDSDMSGLVSTPSTSMFPLPTSELPLAMEDYSHLQSSTMFMGQATPMDLGTADIFAGISPEALPMMFPSYEPGPGMLHTPTSSTDFDRKGSEGSSNGQQPSSFPMQRSMSFSSHQGIDAEAVVHGQDCWTAYKCNPHVPASSCPKSARLHLEKLIESLKNHESWIDWRSSWDEADFALGENLDVLPLQEMARDKLLAITQTFLHKALEIHADEQGLGPSAMSAKDSSNFVLLPPARALEFLLKSYANGFERFYPLTPRGALDPNTLMLRGSKDKAASLLLLLMIAQGAIITPSMDGRFLTGGLTEACRISLFDLIEKNIKMSGDPVVLHAALLFTVQAGWSGDKWQMDIAMGQRGMYFAMLRHSGYLEPQAQQPSTLTQRSNVDVLWQDWMEQESRTRLVYSWVMIDQDLSLFHDTTPMFSITEFGAPMPDTDALWHAKSAAEWSGIFERVHEFSGGYSSVGSGARPMCLRDLFRLFINESIVPQGIQLTPLHLRLLLHPLQSLVCQFRQLLTCLPDQGFRVSAKTVTAASTRVRLEEVQGMLQRWYDLADRYLKSNRFCPLMQANLVMFHLVSLNAVTDFPKIEKLARREGIDGSYQSMLMMHRQCISDVEEAIFHAGQVVRLIRNMPRSTRPPWWAGAMYRVAIIFWCDSLVRGEMSTPTIPNFQLPDSAFPIDGLPPDHPVVIHYLTKREGTPSLTRRDGSHMAIDNPFAVLFHCVDVISEGVPTRFSEGICNKLTKLART